MTNTINSVSNVTLTTPNATPNPGVFSVVPTEILAEILQHISYKDIKDFSLVSRGCCVIVSNFWKFAICHFFPTIKPETENHEHNFVVHTNLKNGICRGYFINTPNGGGTCKVIYKNQLVTGLRDITVWDLKTLEKKASFKHGEGAVRITCLTVHKDQLVSASDRGTIKVWDLKLENCVNFLHQSDDEITAMVSDNKRLVTGDRCGKVIVWDLANNAPLIILKHSCEICALVLHNGRAIVGDIEGGILIFDLETQKCLYQVQEDAGAVYSLVSYNRDLYSCHESTIKIWDLDTLAPKGIVTDSQDPFLSGTGKECRAMQIFEGVVFVNSFQPTLKKREILMWDLTTKKGVSLLPARTSGSTTLLIHDGQLIVDSERDRGVQVCDFTVPEHQMYPVLAQLGIETEEDFEREFGCRGREVLGYLARSRMMGNQFMFSAPAALAPVKILQVEEVVTDSRQAQGVADQRKEALKTYLAELVKVCEEADPLLRKEVARFAAQFEEMIKTCDTPRKLIEAFSLEKYNVWATKLNRLIEAYNGDIEKDLKSSLEGLKRDIALAKESGGI